jgi:hypothetical protein
VEDVTRFAVDYTFWLNLAFALVAAALVALYRQGLREDAGSSPEDGDGADGSVGAKRIAAWTAMALLAGGLVAAALTRS